MDYHELSVARVVDETHDTRSFVLQVPEALQGRFRYQAGQFLTFRIPWEQGELIRCYSLASSPDVDAEYKVTVKRVAEGRVSNWFNDQLRVGDRIRVLPPSGRFVLRESEAPLLLFGGGSGITPVISLVKTALATTDRPAKLFYANRDAASVIFRAELDALVTRHPDRLEVVHHLDAEAGFADTRRLAEEIAGYENAHCYVCGPGPFMDVVEAALRSRQVPREQIFIERFVSPPDGEAPQVEVATEAEVPAEIVVHLEGRTHRVPYRKGQSILQAARAAGLEAPFACEEGYCGSCAAKKLQGQVVMAANDVFDADEVAEGWILTCQSHPTGPVCEVVYED